MPLPCPVVESETRTRRYVNGHATNGFVRDDGMGHRDPGRAGGGIVFAKKVG